MTKERKPERPRRTAVQEQLKKKWFDNSWGILGGLAAMGIWKIGEYIFGQMSSFWQVLLGFVVGLAVASIGWFFAAKRYPDLRRKLLFFFSLVPTILVIVVLAIAVGPPGRLPRPNTSEIF